MWYVGGGGLQWQVSIQQRCLSVHHSCWICIWHSSGRHNSSVPCLIKQIKSPLISPLMHPFGHHQECCLRYNTLQEKKWGHLIFGNLGFLLSFNNNNGKEQQYYKRFSITSTVEGKIYALHCFSLKSELLRNGPTEGLPAVTTPEIQTFWPLISFPHEVSALRPFESQYHNDMNLSKNLNKQCVYVCLSFFNNLFGISFSYWTHLESTKHRSSLCVRQCLCMRTNTFYIIIFWYTQVYGICWNCI